MIIPGTRFRVERVPLSRIVFRMTERRYPERVMEYYRRLVERPEHDVIVHLEPLPDGYYAPLDGHHRTLASVLAGRSDVLALVIIEPGQPGYEDALPDLVSVGA